MVDLDERIGRVLSAAKQQLDWAKTLVIFSSDNGGDTWSDNGVLTGSKRSHFDGGIRVAAFVAGGFLPAKRHGQVEHGLIGSHDWCANKAPRAPPVHLLPAHMATPLNATPCAARA